MSKNVPASPNLAWSVFINNFKPFITARAKSLERMSNGRWTFDDAVQELHQVVWEAVLSSEFVSSRGDWKKWLYNRVAWRTLQMVNSLSAMRRKNEVLVDMKDSAGGDDGDSVRAIAVLEPDTGDASQRHIEARDWINRALDRIQKEDIPMDYQFVVTAYLDPDVGLAEFAHLRGSSPGKRVNRAAKYEIATHADLVDFTGDRKAACRLQRAMEFLVKRLGNPVTGAPPSIKEDALPQS